MPLKQFLGLRIKLERRQSNGASRTEEIDIVAFLDTAPDHSHREELLPISRHSTRGDRQPDNLL